MSEPDIFSRKYLDEVQSIAAQLDTVEIESMVSALVRVRAAGGRLFFLGVGGGAANAAHAVNDFRKIACIESYAPSDSAAELTARVNDEGWEGCYANWLLGSRLCAQDAVFIFSVGGGSIARKVSLNLVESLRLARRVGATVLGVVGRDGGYTAEVAEASVIVPTVSVDSVTPHTEEFQAVILHLLVSHPSLRQQPTKWESLA
jgi:D-sedoheptulose 7-phosphate isomerase